MLKKLANPHAGFLRIDDTAKVSKSTKPNIGASRALSSIFRQAHDTKNIRFKKSES
jgi:hypothetical protein